MPIFTNTIETIENALTKRLCKNVKRNLVCTAQTLHSFNRHTLFENQFANSFQIYLTPILFSNGQYNTLTALVLNLMEFNGSKNRNHIKTPSQDPKSRIAKKVDTSQFFYDLNFSY